MMSENNLEEIMVKIAQQERNLKSLDSKIVHSSRLYKQMKEKYEIGMIVCIEIS